MDTCIDNLLCFTSWSVPTHQTMDIFFFYTKMCFCWQPQPDFPQNNKNSPTIMCPSRLQKNLRQTKVPQRRSGSTVLWSISEDWVMCTTHLNLKLQHTQPPKHRKCASPLAKINVNCKSINHCNNPIFQYIPSYFMHISSILG